MPSFDPETFKTKYNIAETAAHLYSQGDGQFYIRDVAAALEMDPAEIFNYFPDKVSILRFYYASLIIRYESMVSEIEDFESYTLSEKFSNFAFTLFDMLAEQEAFVQDTFDKLIVNSCSKTDFESEIERLLKQFLENDSQLSISSSVALNDCSYSFLRRQFLELIRFWLHDDSENRELTMQLTDKLTAFLQELFYNTVLDKGADLLKFFNANRESFFQNIPFLKQICSKIEIR